MATPTSLTAPGPRLPLCGATREELTALLAELSEPAYRAKQIYRQIYVRGVVSPLEMTDLPEALRERLGERTTSGVPRIHGVHQATDGTRKLLFELADGAQVEGVLIPMRAAYDQPGASRLTQCISTQVGCTLDCSFCLTGTMGLKRNLSAGEIVGQVLAGRSLLEEGERVTRLVYMGMGEPLANYKAVVQSLSLLTDGEGLGISGRRITVSTAGLAHRIAAFGQDTTAMLAVSLNGTTNAQRDRLMPKVNQKYPIEDLVAACRAFPMPSRRRLTFEYVLLAGENDSDDDALRLVELVHGMRIKINLIPYNPHPSAPYQRPTRERVKAFQAILLAAGLATSVRETKGDDVLAACGQLGVPGNAAAGSGPGCG